MLKLKENVCCLSKVSSELKSTIKKKKALTKIFAKFIKKACFKLQKSSLARKQELQYCKY